MRTNDLGLNNLEGKSWENTPSYEIKVDSGREAV
jgi:hypothetical protein